MYDAGYHNIYNMDISTVVIEQMEKRYADKEKMVWEVMDARDMSYADETFDIVIDKSTIDALLCGENAFLNVAKMTKEVQRVLKKGGCYFVISYGRPEARLVHFDRDHLDFSVKQYVLYPTDCKTPQQKLEKSHFIYLATKGEEANKLEGNWENVQKQIQEEMQKEKERIGVSKLEEEKSEESDSEMPPSSLGDEID